MTIDFVKSALGFQNQHLKNETSVLDGLSFKTIWQDVSHM
jgi:hypothetical protein